jgi:preprotein translocase subunit SecD
LIHRATMQGNGFKIGLTAFFVLLCSWYLYPSVQNIFLNYQMSGLQGQELEEYQRENRQYIESVKENSLKLGLDLQGGMHATLEVQMATLLRQLATNKDQRFDQVMRAAVERARQEDERLVNAFVAEFEALDDEARLSRYFRNEEANITRRSDNDAVAEYLRTEADEAVQRAMQVVRNRVNRYGVSEPNIQRQGDRRIVVELPGVDDQQRVRSLLESASQLTFHLTGDPQRLSEAVQRVIEYYEPSDTTQADDTPAGDAGEGEAGEGEAPAASEPDTAAQAAQEGTQIATAGDDTSGTGGTQLTEGGEGPRNPLLDVFQPVSSRSGSAILGQAAVPDTARVSELLNRPAVQEMLPSGIDLLWGSRPVNRGPQGQQGGPDILPLYAIQSEIELSGTTVTDASVEFDRYTNAPSVSLSMDSEGARTWARLTGANVGEQVAIVLDRTVYSAPVIEERIAGGRTSITGLESREEAQDIVNVLRSGSLPTPVDIVEERTVGPSLGEASIRAGFISVTVGLMLVALFMIMYYRTAGVVADIALLLNVILILGILAGFKATLTLPGIAGIVLTIGMAVDANVLIYERVREEQATGKTLRAAIDAGYEKALSAILDANITTFFVGVILYSFGVGPIQGFAVTLMAGILSSLFTAIIVTRLVFDYLIEERRMTVSYG